MKKLLTGCLVILVLGAIALSIGVYVAYRAASPAVQSARDYLDRFSQLGELQKEIKNQTPFNAPATGELTKEQVDRFARVQSFVRSALGERFDEIEAKYKRLEANAGNSSAPPQPSMSEVMSAFRELAGAVFDARRWQIEALNRERFSSAEYSWVRARVYAAAGANVLSLEQLAQAARRGTGIDSIQAPKRDLVDLKVPERNRELLKPHLKQLDEWLPLAFFGL